MTGWFVSILEWIQSFVGSYGWSVIVFSLFIKLCLLPLDIKSRRSMNAMTALNPQMEKLKAKYANDQEKLNRKMQELYSKNKVNPLSGCLPMLIQLPILFIMFAAMRNLAGQLQLEMMYNWISQNLSDGNGQLLAIESDAVQSVLASLKDGSAVAQFGDTQGWLWIKSVFQPDSFSKTFVPTLSELSTTLSQYKNMLETNQVELLTAYVNNTGLAEAVDAAIATNVNATSFYLFLNMFQISIPGNWGTYINGYFILPILAGLTQWLSTKLQPGADASASNSNGTGKFMKWFFPIFSVWICISSTAAFAIYWVVINIWTIISSIAINKILEQDNKKRNNQTPDTTDKEALQP